MTWNIIAQLAISAVSAFVLWVLAPRPGVESARAASFDNFRFPRSKEGDGVPLLLGRRRLLSPNTIWAGGFRSISNRERQSRGWGPFETFYDATVSHSYVISIALALSLGPSVRLHRLWVDKHEVWAGFMQSGDEEDINAPYLFGGARKGGGIIGKMRFYAGDDNQLRDSRIAHFFPDTPAYNGTCYVVFDDLNIGTSPSLRPISFEASRYTNYLAIDNALVHIGDSLNPAEALYHILIVKWGGLNVDAVDIDIASFKEAAQTLSDEDNGVSLLVSRVRNGGEVVSEILRQIDGILYQDPVTALLTLRLIREETDTSGAPHLDETNILEIEEYARTSWSDTINQVRVSYPDQNRKYETSTAIAQDMANIASQNRVKTKTISFPYCVYASLASDLAARELSQLSVPLAKLSVKMNRKDARGMKPGDIVTFSWKKYGAYHVLLRIESVDLGSLTDGCVSLRCVQDRFAARTAVFAPPGASLAPVITSVATPPDKVRVIEAPYLLAAGSGLPNPGENRTYVFTHVHSQNDSEYGYNASFLQDGQSYSLPDVPFTGHGVLEEAIQETDGFDGTEISFKVSGVSEDRFLLSTATNEEKRSGKNLLLIGNEFLSFGSWSSNPDGSVQLQGVSRSLLDTSFESHAQGDSVWIVDAGRLLLDSLKGDEEIVASILTYTRSNILGSPVTASLTPDRRYERPLAPSFVEMNGHRVNAVSQATNTISWRIRSRTNDTIPFVDDPSMTPDPGVTYTLRVYAGTTLQTGLTQTGLTGSTASLTLPSGFPSGAGKIGITAVRAVGGSDLESRSSSVVYFTHQ